ncbi:phosphate-repressible phosphate permease [Cadophora sp. DSE1049]|nr:phosphate-repressible phosphate permease [Cadophora sp. DSE1049]
MHSEIHDKRVEELWKPQLVVAAVLMSISHGSNDVANAVAPWVSAYDTWKSGTVREDANTPIWIVCIAAILIGAGFWFCGYKVVRSLGNKITHVSPTRGFAINIATSLTILVASRLGLPVSTTQCQLGATIGVGLSNGDPKAVNWKQIGFIIMGWFITLPIAGLISGLLMAMELNTPHL